MPTFRIYVPVRAVDMYEVECESKEVAHKMYKNGLKEEYFVGTTDSIDAADVYGISIKELI
jgi:hypothetical protein